MNAFERYQAAKERKRTAYERYNYASLALEVAQIKERFAEIVSQHQPLAELNPGENLIAREKQIKAAFYVLYGRWPTEDEIAP